MHGAGNINQMGAGRGRGGREARGRMDGGWWSASNRKCIYRRDRLCVSVCACVCACVTTGGCGTEAARWGVCAFVRVCVSLPEMHKGVGRGAAGLCPRPLSPHPSRFVSGVPRLRRGDAAGRPPRRAMLPSPGRDRAALGEAEDTGWRCDSNQLADKAALLLFLLTFPSL